MFVVHYATEGLDKISGETISDLPKQPKSAFPNPVLALVRTVADIKENAEEFHVDLNYVVGGFSAGGNVAGQLATMWHEPWFGEASGKEKELIRPTHALLAYADYDVNPGGGSKCLQ